MSPDAGPAPCLLLGPILRYVGTRSATVWVEVSAPCRVQVLSGRATTFEVAGHHYALVVVDDLEPGAATPYDVRLDGVRCWPEPGSAWPDSVIRAQSPAGLSPVRISFGSCRVSTGQTSAGDGQYGVDALEALALRVAAQDVQERPDLLLMLGDQVYADLTSPGTRARIEATRGLAGAPGAQVADFEEYTWLYQESWSLPAIRWLLSAVPVAMIFDDHDIHDDWNTSRAWRQQQAAASWWPSRITGGLMAYWIYQHLGNLSPADLLADDVHRQVQDAAARGVDAAPLLQRFAAAADREADSAQGYRWSYRRDLGRTRLVVLDSRCGRILDGQRSMLSRREFGWALEAMTGPPEPETGDGEPPAVDHLLIGTSVPWLLAPALHALESWNEVRCASPSPRRAGRAERLRQVFDLEHWAAFGASFERLAQALVSIGTAPDGSRTAPATICVLSGDVHHSYVCEAVPADGRPLSSRLVQVTCSPFHNSVPGPMLAAFRLAWNPVASVAGRLLARVARVPRPSVRWRLADRVLTGDAVAGLELRGRAATVVIERAAAHDGAPVLVPGLRLDLS